MPAIRLAAVDFGDDGQVIDVTHRRQRADGAEAIAAFRLDRRAIKTLFRQTHIVSQRVAGDIVRCLCRRHFTRGFADNQRHRRAALYGLALRIGDRLAVANHGIARLDKPDRGFRRRLVGGLLKRFAPGVELAAMIERNGEDGTFHSPLLWY